jgi:hypothetical protein
MACCLAASKLALLAPLLQFHSTFDSSCCQVLKITPRHGIRSRDKRHFYFRMTWAVQDKSFISLALLWHQQLEISGWVSAASWDRLQGRNKWLRFSDETTARPVLRWLQGIWDLFLDIIHGHIINTLGSAINHFTSY